MNKKYVLSLSVCALLCLSFSCVAKTAQFGCKTQQKAPNLHINYTPEDKYYEAETTGGLSQKEVLSTIGDIESVWDVATGKGITVAVIDTGVDINHLDFEDCVLDSSAYFYVEYDEEDESIYEVKHQIGKEYLDHPTEGGSIIKHGSGTAGTILAKNNQYGTVGIAFDANLLAIKCDLDSLAVNEAIIYAVDNGAKVINISMGGYAAPYTDRYGVIHNKQYEDYDERDAYRMSEGINYAYKHNVAVIASAGNEGTSDSSFPASNEHVIGVGALAMKSSIELAAYTNFNKAQYDEGVYPNVDIVAPGTVVAPNASNKDHQYDDVTISSGTSYSAPIVSGAAALWFEKNPSGTVDEFEKALYESATDLGEEGFDIHYGNGVLNINKLILGEKKEVESIDHIKELSLKVGEEHQLIVTVNPSDAEYEIEYISSDEKVVTIDNNGLIKAVNSGEVTINIIVGKISGYLHVLVEKDNKNSSSCGGEILVTSGLLSIMSLMGIVLIFIKKKIHPYY